LLEWFAGPKESQTRIFDAKKSLQGLRPVSNQAMIDFNWSLRWGRLQKIGFVWKYGNPWNYPSKEFEELKTLSTAMLNHIDSQKQTNPKHDRPELPEDVKQKKMLTAKNFHQAMSRGQSA
jgi:hypothetical protein